MARARPAPRDAPRVPLNRERVLGAALALADGSGVEALSMRRLARTVGVENPFSSHWSFGPDVWFGQSWCDLPPMSTGLENVSPLSSE